MSRSVYHATLLGYANDIKSVCNEIDSAAVHWYDESSAYGATAYVFDAKSPIAETVVYVYSIDTCYSSQLLSLFDYVHRQRRPKNEYVYTMPIPIRHKKRFFVFDVLNDVPQISIEQLKLLAAGRPWQHTLAR